MSKRIIIIMTSKSNLYRVRKRIKLNTVLQESPYLQSSVRVSTKWPGQLVARNQRFIQHSINSLPNVNAQIIAHDVQAAAHHSIPLPLAITQNHQQPESQTEVCHLHLSLSTPCGVENIYSRPLDENSVSPIGPHETASDVISPPQLGDSAPDLQSTVGTHDSIQHTQLAACDVLLPQPRDLTKATVGKYINNLDIPAGLHQLWTIFRKHQAPNVMMGEVLHWFREHQIELALAISKQSIPDHLKLPLDYRGSQKALQLSSVFHVDVFCFCKECDKWKPRSIFEKPFQIPCCRLLPNPYDSHFVVYEIHEILELLLPHYKPKIQSGYYKGCSRLEHMRRQVNGTDDDVYVSIGYDGVPFSPSSGISVYPVLGTIDGLSGQHTKGSTFILALWMGSLTASKPDVRTIFAPIVAQFKKLAANPMTWVDYAGQTKTSRVFLSTILTDTVARPQVMCLTQFNGTYGCAWCLHERNKTSLWDYKNPDEQAPLRTNDNLRGQLSQLFDDQGNVVDAGHGKNDGIQGRTPFADLHYFDIVQDFPPCTMHANYEGNCKRLLKFWLCKKNGILTTTQQNEIDAFLVSLKPPARITRPPRQLCKVKKAAEHCVLLLYTLPIVLQNYLPKAMYDHFLNLVRGLSYLHKDDPTSVEINTAEQQLTDFLSDYSIHYGSGNQSYNIHILLHLCAFVRARGPLYRYSLMPMESYNKHIKELPTGPKYVTMQMCTRFLEETVFKSKMHSKPTQPFQLQFEGVGEHMVSTCPLTFIKEYLAATFGPTSGYFERLRFGRRTIHSLSYSAVTTTNSSCFKIGERLFFDAHVFVKTPEGYQACGKELHGDIFNGIWYIFKCVESESVSIIHADLLKTVVFKIEYNNSIYISEFLNDFESYAE